MLGNIPKTGPACVKSRHFPEFSFRDVRIHLRQNLVKFSGGKIAFHLFIPLVIGPGMKTRGDLRSFLKGELPNRFFDFSNAHIENLPDSR
jgi:hypothetical protein